MKKSIIVLALISLSALAGCSVFNPYESDFQCKDAGTGQCKTMKKAYMNALDEKKDADTEEVATSYFKKTYRYVASPLAFSHGLKKKMLVYQYEPVIQKRKLPKVDPEVMYQKNKFETLGKLLGEQDKPLVAPPKVLKVLIFPYSSGERSEVLNMHRYVFLKVEDSQWVFDSMEVE
jgi:conjugal transfer pilus assembly protein TraV